MCSIIGVGERLHKVLGQIDLGTLDSGERSLPFGLLVYNNVTQDSVTCTLTLCHVTENGCVKCPVHYLLGHFSFIELLTKYFNQ